MITYEKTTPVEYRPYVEAVVSSGVFTGQIWTRIRQRKWLILFLSAALFAVFTALLFVLPVSYTASTEIVVEQRPQSVDLAALLSRMPTDNQAVLTEAEALRSRTLVHETIKHLGLLSNPEFNPKILRRDGSLRSRYLEAKMAVFDFIQSLLPESDSPPAGDPVLDEATSIFLKNFRVTPIGRSQILKATFTAEDPELASRILNEMVDHYLTTQMQNRVAVPNKMSDFLKGEIDRLQAKVRDANAAVERFRSKARLQQGITQGRETLLHTQELSDANSELMAVRVKRQAAEARLNEIRANPDSFSDVLASTGLQQLRREQSLLKDQRSQLSSTYGRAHPQLKALEASIADNERRMNAEVAKVARSLASEVKVQTERQAQLEETVANLKSEMQKAGESRVTLLSLEQDAEVNRSTLNTFLTQYNQLTSQRGLHISDSYVLARADVPTQPSFPPLVPFLGLAAVVSVASSALIALLVERPGKTIRSSLEVRPLLTARSLGVIPRLGAEVDLFMHVIDQPQSPFTEAIRIVLTRFIAPRALGRTVLVASAQCGEGRTSIAVALARLAALAGRRAILVDCDLRTPFLHAAFGAPVGPGLTDVLQGHVTLDEAIRPDTRSPVHYIAAGNLDPHAANLLCLPEMVELLGELRKEYDLVILDSPPSAAVADTSLLAQFVDDCLFVVSWNKTPWRLVREQMEDLSHHCEITGVVLNQVDMLKHARYQPGHIDMTRMPEMLGPPR